MVQGTKTTPGTWLTATSQVLYGQPERLQQLVLEITEQTPELGCYASDLARLRMSGLIIESMLYKLWNAKTADLVDQLIQKQWDHPCAGAIHVLANLVKNDLHRGYRLHPTVH